MRSPSEPFAPPSRLWRLRLWIDRHPAISALALGCLLALVLSALPAGASRTCARSHWIGGSAAHSVACRPVAQPKG